MGIAAELSDFLERYEADVMPWYHQPSMFCNPFINVHGNISCICKCGSLYPATVAADFVYLRRSDDSVSDLSPLFAPARMMRAPWFEEAAEAPAISSEVPSFE